jgi:hypothetical protein
MRSNKERFLGKIYTLHDSKILIHPTDNRINIAGCLVAEEEKKEKVLIIDI